MEKLLIIDGNSLLFRAYYATAYGSMMKTKQGIPTNAIFAFANMLSKALDNLQPTHCVVAFDKGKETFRHQMYADYKAGRKKAPDELVFQFKLVRDYLTSYNIPYFELEEYEADDIVGTFSKMYQDIHIDILSSDKDLLQLIHPTCDYLMIKKGMSEIETMTPEKLNETMGLTPSQIPDLKGLMGDASDNIQGVKGIGEKTALKLLHQYQSIENIYEHIDEIKGKTKTLLENQKVEALTSKQLATIYTDIKMDVPLSTLIFEPNYQTLQQFYLTYEMRSLANRLPIDDCSEQLVEIQAVTTISSSLLTTDSVCYFDCDEFDYYHPTLYGLCVGNNESYEYISIENLKKDQGLLDYFKSEQIKVVYDVKRIYHLLDAYQIMYQPNRFFDIRLAGFLYNPQLSNFDSLIHEFGYHQNLSHESVYGTTAKMKLVDLQMQMNYAQEKTHLIQTIMPTLKEKIEEFQMHHLYYEVELPLSYVLYKMEKEGICVDLAVLNEIAEKTLAILDDLKQVIYAYASTPFNINSPKQLAVVLFDELQLPANKKRSTSVEVLEKLEGIHPIIESILAYRKYTKIYSTYAEGLKKYVQPDHKIHTQFNQCATLTGRLSSTEPNLQNISVRDEEGKEIRKAFVANENHLLLSCDYSQVELRMLADIADEKGLIEAFVKKQDIHTITASDIFHVSAEEVDDNLRRKAKAVNFGIVYGISDFGLAKQVNSSVIEARSFIQQYFISYPNIKKYMEDIVEECSEKGYVSTILNRRRYIPEIHDKNFMVKEFGKRAAMNTPIQGSAADLIKVAMVHIDEMMKQAKVESKMILQVHDELIFDVPKEELEIMINLVEKGMQEAMSLKVPLIVNPAYGTSWYEAK
ncbi:MAG: DNA polymerase I [Erysipelotrichaceae bacterium]